MKEPAIPCLRHRQTWRCIAVLTLLAACAAPPPSKPMPYPEAPPPLRLSILPGDLLEIKFPYVPELNESQTVREDGMISLPFIGDVRARDKTPDELRAELIARYARELKKPELLVLVRSRAARLVYVGGEVVKPGALEMREGLTVLEAIMAAGGPLVRSAELSNVVIVRHRDNRRYGGAVDLSEAFLGYEGRAFYLEPQDIVFVPRTRIAEINQWIDEHINKMVPQFGWFFSVPVGTTTIGINTSN
jgi:protein involved in polysaccharide export with SLBB domain